MSTRRKAALDRDAAPVAAPSGAAGSVDGDWIVGRLLLLVFVCSVLYAIWTASIGWGNTLNDRHSFRQSQTATTAYWMIGKPFRLAYETPVLGKPWAIPMEFPLYQWIVARIVGLCGTPLDQTGRFVSLAFFLLTTIPLYRIVRSLGVASHLAWLPLILFVTSPFYIFWSRTFMIESTALFFAVSYLAAAIEVTRNRSWPAPLLAIVLGALAGMIKVTTFAGYLAVVGLMLGWHVWRAWRAGTDPAALARSIVRYALVVALPFVAAVGWVWFADGVKAANPLAASYLTSQAPHNSTWNYGTLEQKCSGLTWGVILGRFPELVGLPPLAWLLLGAVLAVSLIHQRRWKETLGCLGAFLLAPAIFTNVHFVHDYYANANGIFLIAGIGFALVGLLEDRATRAAGVTLTVVAILATVTGHAALYRQRQMINSAEVLDAAEHIRSATPDDSSIVCLSNDWSPLVSYYAQRRALNLPLQVDGSTPQDVITATFRQLKGEKVGAIVLVEPVLFPLETAKQQLRELGIQAPVLTIKGLQKF